MHRRAQAAERRAHRAESRSLDYYALKLLSDMHWRKEYALRRMRFWKDRYQYAARKIRETGLVVSERKNNVGWTIVEGRLEILVDLLVAAVRPAEKEKETR